MDHPVATVIKPNRPSKPANASSGVTRGVARSVSADDQSEGSTSPAPSRGRFRKRTARQKRPFKIDKVEHNLAKKGVKASEAELAGEVQNSSGNSKRTREDSAASFRSAKRPASSKRSMRVSDIEVIDVKETTIRTWLNGFPSASLPLPLTESSVKELFKVAAEAWRFRLSDKSIAYGIVSFPWLNEHSNIIFSHDNNETAFEVMLDEVRRSPTWGDEGRCSIDLEIFA